MVNQNLLVNLTDIKFGYSKDVPVLNNLNLKLFKNDQIGLLAPNGSGKTTLFHIMMGLLKPDKGNVEIFGKTVKEERDFLDVRQRIGLLFQDTDDQLFSPTVLEDVVFGPLNLGISKEEAIETSKEVLAFLGLQGFEERLTFKLSGGEKRLVALATVLAMKPEILLLDEPINGLDHRTKSTIIDVLSKLDITYIIISHDMDFLEATTKNIYTMEEGMILFDTKEYVHRHSHIHTLGNRPHKH